MLNRYFVAIGLCLLSALLIAWPIQAATLIVGNKSDASVSLFRLPEGREIARLPTGIGPHEVAVSPDGRRALVSDYGDRDIEGRTLTLIDIPLAAVIKTIILPEKSRPHGVEWLSNREAVVTAEGIDSLLRVDVDKGAVTGAVKVDQKVAHMVAVAHRLQRAYVANILSGTLSVVDLNAMRLLKQLESGEGTEGVAVMERTGEVWAANRAEDTLTIFDARNLIKKRKIEAKGFPIRVEADNKRGQIYVTQAHANGFLVFGAAGEELAARQFPFGLDPSKKDTLGEMFGDTSIPVGVQLSGDGKRLFVAHSGADLVSVHDPDTLQHLGNIATGREPDAMGWSKIDVGM